MQVTDRLRIGAQLYLRNVGELGNWHPVLDWGFADYRVRDWFGLRGGRVKTGIRSFSNDVQDNEFLTPGAAAAEIDLLIHGERTCRITGGCVTGDPLA